MRFATLYRREPDPLPDADEVRRARLEIARRNASWQEIDEALLVPRARGWLVHAETDEIFAPVRGTVFASGTATLIATHPTALVYTVSKDGDLRFFERVGKTWSEVVERQERRRLRAGA